MRRVFLSCVGARDPYWNSENGVNQDYNEIVRRHGSDLPPALRKGPILDFFMRHRPRSDDRMYLLYTAVGRAVRGPTATGAEGTCAALVADYGVAEEQIFLVPLNRKGRVTDPEFDPSSYATVMRSFREACRRVVEVEEADDAGSPPEYWIIYSSGTPQMQAAWVVLADSGLIPARLFRAEGNEVVVESLFEDQLLTQACRFFSAFDFGAAAGLLAELEKRADRSSAAIARDRRGIFSILARVCHAYRDWSTFDYAKALDELKDARAKGDRFIARKEKAGHSARSWRKFLAKLREQILFLEGYTGGREWHPADLLVNAERHYHRGQYAEAVWRLDVACERAAVSRALAAIESSYSLTLEPQYFRDQLASLAGIRGSATRRANPARRGQTLPSESAREAALGLVDKLYGGNPQFAPRHLTDADAREVLGMLEPELMGNAAESVDLEVLARIRNRVVHRAAPTRPNEAYRCLTESQRYVAILVGNRLAGRHPLAPQPVAALAEMIRLVGAGRL